MFGNERRLARIEGKLDLILNLQRFFARLEFIKMSAISDAVEGVAGKVTKLTSVVDGVGVTLTTMSQTIKDLTAQLASSGDVPSAVTKLNELSTAIDAEADEIAANIAANTPAAPPA